MIGRLFGRGRPQPDPEYMVMCREALQATVDHFVVYDRYDAAIQDVVARVIEGGPDLPMPQGITRVLDELNSFMPLGRMMTSLGYLEHRPPRDSRLADIHKHLINMLEGQQSAVIAVIASVLAPRLEAPDAFAEVQAMAVARRERADEMSGVAQRGLEAAVLRLKQSNPDLAWQIWPEVE